MLRLGRGSKIALGAIVGIVLIFMYVPLMLVMVNSFNDSRIAAWPVRAFSTRWWEIAATSEPIRAAVLNSVVVGLGRRYPDAVTYAVDGVVGASPETLIAAHRGHFFSRVLAGTAARGATPSLDAEIAESLASGDKDVREHRFAADSAIEVLRELAPDTRASEPFPLRLPNLWHLATDITGTLGGSSTLDVLALLHPTAAVAGTPRAAALAIIRELERVDRGRYAGPVGWVDAEGGGEWVIALRGAEIDAEGCIRAFAGAGVVAGSDPHDELTETAVKLRPITDALADPLP